MVNDYPGTTIDQITRHHADVARVPILRGEIVDVTFKASAVASVPHGLGRPYRGAMVVASTDPTVAVSAYATAVASGSGVDVRSVLLVAASAVNSATFTLWVF